MELPAAMELPPANEQPRPAWGRLLLLAAALLWSLSGVLVKSPALAEIASPALAGFRALIAAAVLAPLVPLRAVRFRPQLIPMVICFALMNFVFITALTRTTAAAAIFLQYTSTFWALVFGMLFLGERTERGNLVAVTFGLLGIGWIVWADWAGERFLGNALALVSGLSYGFVIICLRRLRQENSAWLIALNHLVSGLVLLPWIWAAGGEFTPAQWVMIFVLGAVQMALPYLLFAASVRHVSAQEAALITMIEPILNPLWVWLMWGEQVELHTWIGGSLILLGLTLRYTVFRGR